MLGRYIGDAYTQWLSSAVSCCASLGDCERSQKLDGMPFQYPIERPTLTTKGIEKPMIVLHNQQPRLIPPPRPFSQYRPSTRSSAREVLARSRDLASRAASRGSFSVRRKVNAYNGPRRPRIGSPTDFRHVQNVMPRRTERFKPLELSIYLPENRLSPILPYFGASEEVLPSFPPPTFAHDRSMSSSSAHLIPRKPVYAHGGSRGGSFDAGNAPSRYVDWVSPSAVDLSIQRPSLDKELPAFPAPARLRHEPPNHNLRASEQYTRVRSVLKERDDLDRRLHDLDDMIERRRSVYASRPPTATATYLPPPPSKDHIPFNLFIYLCFIATPPTQTSQPTIIVPILTPPSTPPRPSSKPTLRIPHPPLRHASFTSHPPTPPDQRTYRLPVTISPTEPPPPPLPLTLISTTPYPPLRKKKSFSTVSKWLFPTPIDGADGTDAMQGITNSPRPIGKGEGFYRCVELSEAAEQKDIGFQHSSVSLSTLASEGDISAHTPSPDKSTRTQQSPEVVTPRTAQEVFVLADGDGDEDEDKVSTFGRKTGRGMQQRLRATDWSDADSGSDRDDVHELVEVEKVDRGSGRMVRLSKVGVAF
jgi:hypothetical protein